MLKFLKCTLLKTKIVQEMAKLSSSSYVNSTADVYKSAIIRVSILLLFNQGTRTQLSLEAIVY